MSEEESVNELKRQLQVKDEELRAMKTSFDEYVESSKELEMELEGALDDVILCTILCDSVILCLAYSFCQIIFNEIEIVSYSCDILDVRLKIVTKLSLPKRLN